jgi:hypothetical protein
MPTTPAARVAVKSDARTIVGVLATTRPQVVTWHLPRLAAVAVHTSTATGIVIEVEKAIEIETGMPIEIGIGIGIGIETRIVVETEGSTATG